MLDLCCNNCHHHSARAMSLMGIESSGTMIKAWYTVTLKGRYVSWARLLQTYLPFLIIVGIILGFYFGLHR